MQVQQEIIQLSGDIEEEMLKVINDMLAFGSAGYVFKMEKLGATMKRITLYKE